MIFSCFTSKLKEKVGGLLGGQRSCWPPSPILGGAWPPSSYAYALDKFSIKFKDLRYFSWNLQPQKIQLMYFLIFERTFNSKIHQLNLKSQFIYEQYFNYILATIVSCACKRKNPRWCGYFVYWEKICQILIK